MGQDQQSRAANDEETSLFFEIPHGACDSHTHIFGDPTEFPLHPRRSYTLGPALPDEMAELHRRLKIDRVVIVTPSVYGTDNNSTLTGIAARGEAARGVALIDEATTAAELDRLDRGGIRGVRLNFLNASFEAAQQTLKQAIDRVQSLGWHIQILTSAPLVTLLASIVQQSPIPVVFDHFAGAIAELGLGQPGFADLVACVRSGKAYVKISAAYRQSQQAPNYENILPLAQALIAANADRVLWGTDWPHPDSAAIPGRKPTDVSPRLPIDDAAMLNLLDKWAPDAQTRTKILVDNPVRLYGF